LPFTVPCTAPGFELFDCPCPDNGGTLTRPNACAAACDAGAELGQGTGVVILLHGRNSSAQYILGLVPRFGRPELTYLAPAASDHTWYPFTFLSEISKNEPWLSSALETVGEVVARGEAEIGFQQMGELLHVGESIDVVGPLPQEIQNITVFSGGVHAQASQPGLARALLEFLSAPTAAAVIRSKGMEPAFI